ncbi:MAG: hypothetical protein KAS59_01085 [Alphaproteobacteria bacterium]|nr:hypothetical protein [Alphaproteobacteria bacterium]MCK5555346.1 hypothetical protein [Alphaproteobacteria bacterium]
MEKFLKEFLKTNVINMADQGLMSLVVMDKYLQSNAWKNNPPRLRQSGRCRSVISLCSMAM